MCLLGRGFHTLIKNVSFSSSTDMESHNPPSSGPSVLAGTHSLLQLMWDPPISSPSGPNVLAGTPPRVHRGSASSLAHRLMSDSDPICNSPSPSLADIVFSGFSLSGFPSRFLKRVCKGEVSTPL